MFWACFVQFSQNTRFCSTPAVTRGLGRRVEPWRPSCFPLNTGESAFDLSSGPECHVIFHLQLSECHEGDTLWFYQLLTCCIIFYCSTNVYISWRFPITTHIAIVVSTLMVFLGSKHCIIQIQMTWNWMDVISEIRANKTLLFFLSKHLIIFVPVLCIHCQFLYICLVTHTSQSCLHGCLRCWARPLPSSLVFTPCFRMKFRSWWVKMSQAFSNVFVRMQSLDIWNFKML